MGYQDAADNIPVNSRKVADGVKKVANNAKELTHQTTDILKKSGADWLEYVGKHPFQSMLYGIVVYFSIKGVLKNK